MTALDGTVAAAETKFRSALSDRSGRGPTRPEDGMKSILMGGSSFKAARVCGKLILTQVKELWA